MPNNGLIAAVARNRYKDYLTQGLIVRLIDEED